jgi:hypothetical protein
MVSRNGVLQRQKRAISPQRCPHKQSRQARPSRALLPVGRQAGSYTSRRVPKNSTSSGRASLNFCLVAPINTEHQSALCVFIQGQSCLASRLIERSPPQSALSVQRSHRLLHPPVVSPTRPCSQPLSRWVPHRGAPRHLPGPRRASAPAGCSASKSSASAIATAPNCRSLSPN